MSLLELLLVLSIAGIILLSALRYYAYYQKTQQVYQLETSINHLMDALNNYYSIHCLKNTLIINQDLKEILITTGLLPTPLFNPWGGVSNLTAEILQDAKHHYLLSVSVNIIWQQKPAYADTLAAFIRNALNGDLLQTDLPVNSVTWTRLPMYTSDSLSSQEWIFGFKPVSLTAVNNGMGSNLWVLNNNLRLFTQQNTAKQNDKNLCVP